MMSSWERNYIGGSIVPAVTLVDQFTHSLMNVPEVTRESVLTRDKNGDFSRQVIYTLFRLTTMDWTRIFDGLRETIYLQPTVKVPSFCYQWFGDSV